MPGRSREAPQDDARRDDASRNHCRAEAVIRNRKGLHARASAQFVKCAETFEAEVQVSREGQTVLGTSIMGLMMLAASPGCSIRVTARGPEAKEVMAALEVLISGRFGEEC